MNIKEVESLPTIELIVTDSYFRETIRQLDEMKKTIILNEFFSRLSQLKSKGYQIYQPNQRKIRLRFGEKRFCPLTAVYYSESGEFLFEDDFANAAEKLGIPEKIAIEICDAADCYLPETDTRKKLLSLVS